MAITLFPIVDMVSGDLLMYQTDATTDNPVIQLTTLEQLGAVIEVKQNISIALSDENSQLTGASGTVPKATFHMPYSFDVSSVKAGLTTAGTGAALVTVNLKADGVSLLSTVITIDAGEKTSATAATPPVLGTVPKNIPADSLVECFLTQIDTDNVATGLKVYFIGNVA